MESGGRRALPTSSTDYPQRVPESTLASKEPWICSICWEVMSEPMTTNCGHSFCCECIHKQLILIPYCPTCQLSIGKDKLFPNLALSNVLKKMKDVSSKSAKVEILEAVGIAYTERTTPVNLLTASFENMSSNEVDKLLATLQRQRDLLASDETDTKKILLDDFLGHLLETKTAEKEKLAADLSLIRRHISVVRELKLTGTDETERASPYQPPNIESHPRYSDLGFNTRTLEEEAINHQSLSARKQRMCASFKDLAQEYYDCRTSQNIENNSSDVAAFEGHITREDFEMLDDFGETLHQMTQFHGVKTLATLSYINDTRTEPTNENTVTNLRFDKDTDHLAISGVQHKIQVFDYVNVIRQIQDTSLPSAELVGTSRIYSTAWSNFYCNKLASSERNGLVTLWDLSTRSKIRNFDEHIKQVWSVDMSYGDAWLLASGSSDTQVKLWSTNSKRSVATLDANRKVCSVNFCPKQSTVIAFSAVENLYYYDFRNAKKPLAIIPVEPTSCVKFLSKDELVSLSRENTLKLWSLGDSASCKRTYTGHKNKGEEYIECATDGNYIACGSDTRSLYFYSKFSTKPLFSYTFADHFRPVARLSEKKAQVQFITWKKNSPVFVAANNQGVVTILELI